MAARAQRPMDGVEWGPPPLVIDDDLGHVTGHDRQVGLDILKFVQTARVPVDPAHEVAARPVAGDVEHGPRRVHADHAVAVPRQLARQEPCAAPDVDNRRGG